MSDLYPLLFTPVFKERVWGGRSLQAWYPHLPAGPVGEAWVLSGHPSGLTPVANGSLAGQTLPELTAAFGARLLGERGAAGKTAPFPLLFKLLDAREDLSVQVHPRDDYPGLPPGELGKTEMWVVLQADPGARAVYGLAPGTTPESFRQAVLSGRTMRALRQIEVLPGDVLSVPAGTVHALGAGLVVAEVQQSSDTVYRVYDYDRPGLDGNPRELHIEHALAVSTYGEPPEPTRPAPPAPGIWQEICRSEYFVVEQGAGTGDQPWPQTGLAGTFTALLVLEGAAGLAWPQGRLTVHQGTAALVPSELASYSLEGAYRALRVYVP